MSKVTDWLKHAFNAFEDDASQSDYSPVGGMTFGGGYSTRPDRIRFYHSNEKSIVSAIYNRLAVDFASIQVRHIRLDEAGRFQEEIDSDLNNCLKVQANIDQEARAFRQDIAATLFDKGCIAIVPTDTTINPKQSGSYDIQKMRVGEIVQWYPDQVKVSVYNEIRGKRQEILLPKKNVAIVENPFYNVMNEQSSTLQRLIRKLNILDAIDEQSGSGKLDLIIQLPYVIKSEARRQQAIQRREDIEFQLKGSKYGVAYTDGTEKITQLNRPAENNLQGQIEYLVQMLYGQLGLTPEIMNGTADEKTMLNYINRTIEPVLDAVVEAMRATFLTKTARTQNQTIEYFRDPFKLVPIANIADIADKFSRNEILTPNEIRQAIGYKPSTDPKADKLQNSNMPQSSGSQPAPQTAPPMSAPSEQALSVNPTQEGDSQNGS